MRGVFISVFLLVLLLFLQVINNPGQAPSILGYQPFTVLSNSMNPAFETRDLIINRKMEASKIHWMMWLRSKKKVGHLSHRVVEVLDDQDGIGFITKGDNNNTHFRKIVR